MAPPVAWQTHPPQRSPEVPVKGLRARPEGRPGHGRLGVAHTEVTGFTCRGAGRSPSGMPCLPRQRIKGFESRSEQDDSYICGSICDAERESMDTAAWARNVGQLIRDIFGAEEEEVVEWIRSLGQLIRAGLGLAFAGITAWSIAALSSEESSFAFGRAEHIGFLVVGVLGLFLLSCKSIARQPWWRSKDTFLVAYECDELRDDLRRL